MHVPHFHSPGRVQNIEIISLMTREHSPQFPLLSGSWPEYISKERDELNLSLSFLFSFSVIKLVIAWSNCSIMQLGFCVPISFKCHGSDFCYWWKQLCSQ